MAATSGPPMTANAAAPSARGTVALAYAAFVLVGVGAGVGGVVIPAQVRDYGVDLATIGLTFLTGSAGFFLAGATTGALLHRLGTRGALLVGGLVSLLAAVVTAGRPSFVVLVAVQLAAGYGVGILESVLNVVLAGLPSAATLLNRLHAFFGVGALLGPVLAATLLRTQPWTTVSWVLAGATALLLVGVLVVVPGRRDVARPAAASARPSDAAPADPSAGEPASAGDTASPGEPVSVAGPASAGRTVAAVSRQPGVVLAALFLTLYVGLEVSVGSWAFTYLVDERGLAAITAGSALSAFWLGLTAGRFVISPVAGRLGVGVERTTAACLLAAPVAIALLGIAPGGPLAGAALALLGFVLGPLFPTAMAVVPRLTTAAGVATAIGLMNAVSTVGGAALPWLAGAVAEGVGTWTLVPFVLVLGLAQVLVWRGVARRMAPAVAS